MCWRVPIHPAALSARALSGQVSAWMDEPVNRLRGRSALSIAVVGAATAGHVGRQGGIVPHTAAPERCRDVAVILTPTASGLVRSGCQSPASP